MSNGQIMELSGVPVLPVPRTVNKVVGTTPTRIVSPDGNDYARRLVLLSDKNGWNVRPGNSVALSVSAVDATANTLTVTGHLLATGFGPYIISSTGTVPGGTTNGTPYYIIKVDANTIKLATTIDNANRGIFVDLSSVGSGTITIADGTAVSATEFPAASVTDGSGSVYIPDKGNLIMYGIQECTVRGYAADSVLTYYWI